MGTKKGKPKQAPKADQQPEAPAPASQEGQARTDDSTGERTR